MGRYRRYIAGVISAILTALITCFIIKPLAEEVFGREFLYRLAPIILIVSTLVVIVFLIVRGVGS